MRNSITYVPQLDRFGCTIACLAMVLGQSYAEMKLWLEAAGWTADKQIHGASDFIYREVLHRHGFSVVQFFQHDPLAGKPRVLWPPAPFAPIHICCVELSNGYHHAIVLLEDGEVLDPDKPDCKFIDHSDYRQIVHITGIFPLRP